MDSRSRLSPLTFFPTRRLWHTTVLFPACDLDFALASALAGSIDLAIFASDRVVIVSLEDCTYCDTAVLTTLVTAKRLHGKRFLVVLPAEHSARRLLALLDWEAQLQPIPTLAEGLVAASAASVVSTPSPRASE